MINTCVLAAMLSAMASCNHHCDGARSPVKASVISPLYSSAAHKASQPLWQVPCFNL